MEQENKYDCIKVKNIPHDVLITLANHLPYDWKKFCRFLLINEDSLNCLIEEFKTVHEQIMQAISNWCKKNPSKSWGDIKAALVSCERNDLVIECEKKLLNRHLKFGVQPPINTFFSREDELLLIHQYLVELQTLKKHLVLSGMSGVGKSQLAKRYCMQFDKFYDNLLWIDAAFGKIQNSMISLSELLELNTRKNEEDTFNIYVVIKKIHHYFKGEKTLYIFDNVDDESVKDFEKYISVEINSFTLITSQWTNWSDDFQQIPIKPFSKEDAFLFGKNRIKTNDDERLREITNELKYHPFAINQAIIYIIKNRVSLEKYLDLFRSHPAEILENGLQQPEQKSAITSINLVLCKLETSHTIPLKILNILSYCDSQKITKKFICEISKRVGISEEYIINDVISLLCSYSLLDWFGNDSDHLTMHEITQIACKNYQKKKGIQNKIERHVAHYFHQQLKATKDHTEYPQDFVSHFIKMFRTTEPRMCKELNHVTSNIQILLSAKCLFQAAINILNSILKYNIQTFGENDSRTLDTSFNIAWCLNNLGKYNEALEVFNHVKRIQTKILGNDHPSLLDTKHNIALCLDNMGKYKEALEMYKQVEEIKARINHPSLLDTKHNIALCLFNMGKYKEALEMYYYVENIDIDQLGCNHPSLLSTKHNIALCLENMGKYKDALKIYYHVEKIKTEINHSSLLNTKHNIALCLYKMGKYNEALEIYYYVEKRQIEVLGNNHPKLMDTKHNIALCLYKKGKYIEALNIYYHVEKIKTEVLGIRHPSLMTTKHNIALCYNKMGKYLEALEIYYCVENIQTEILGVNHPSLQDTKHNIALCLLNLGKYDQALEICYCVQKIKAEILENDHPSLLDTKHSIALCLNKLGSYEKALEIYYYVEKIQSDILGNDHPSLLDTQNNIAICLNNMGKYNEAMDIFNHVEKIQSEVLGNDHPSLLDTKHNIAICFSNMQKYDEALEINYYLEKIKTEILGINHPSLNDTKYNIALCLDKMGKYKDALEVYYYVEKKQTEVLGTNHPSLLNTKHSITLCLKTMKIKQSSLIV